MPFSVTGNYFVRASTKSCPDQSCFGYIEVPQSSPCPYDCSQQPKSPQGYTSPNGTWYGPRRGGVNRKKSRKNNKSRKSRKSRRGRKSRKSHKSRK